jgi:hypothetical protein
MPKEVRYLIFSNEELYQALVADLRARSYPLPRGFLKSISLGTSEQLEVTLVYLSDKGSEFPIRFEYHDVLRAMIVYCGQRNIPLSAKSTKTLEVKNGMLGLMCTLNFNNDKIAASGNTLSYQDAHTEKYKDAAKSAAAAANKAPSTPKVS